MLMTDFSMTYHTEELVHPASVTSENKTKNLA